MPTQPTLRTDRLLLSPLEVADIPLITKYAANKNISRYTMNLPYPYAEADAVFWLNLANTGYKSGTHHIFAIRAQEDGAFMGGIGLTMVPDGCRATLGYWIAEPFWGQGLVTEAAREIVRYGISDLDLNKITATHIAENVASGRVMQKIGMSLEGVLRQDILKAGTYHDHVCYGILSSELPR
ncbi:GNAT family N-acetyltransferase [Neolewinella aurantiaca]|uniref:GNAT family N-acetyltransferase n=1 Tax=Neolewinella aurantiaca TaxID=2602767 RepID=A0A5C7G055_9BACT|nr:GNAT family protein [Neolewinella aurantiaca]TXF91450.1 GNAT family N-acetyltransferase [Neolewinella aurantiaca]